MRQGRMSRKGIRTPNRPNMSQKLLPIKLSCPTYAYGKESKALPQGQVTMLVGRERSPSLRDASMGQDHFFQVGRSGKVLLRQATSPYGRDHPYLCFLSKVSMMRLPIIRASLSFRDR